MAWNHHIHTAAFLDVYFKTRNCRSVVYWDTAQPDRKTSKDHCELDLWPIDPLIMLVTICAKYGKNMSRTVCAVEQSGQVVPYFSSFIAKSWPNDFEDIGQGQRTLHATHPFMLVIICATYIKIPSRTVCTVEQTCQDVPYFSIFILKSWLNDLEGIGLGQRWLCITHPLMLVIICAKCGKKSIQNCRSYRADME